MVGGLGVTEIRTYTGHSLPVFDLRCVSGSLPGSGYFLSESLDGTARLWDLGSARQVHEFSSANAIAFSPDGNSFVVSTPVGELQLCRLTDRSILKTLSGNAGAIHSAAFAPDGKFVVTGGQDRTLRLWDLESGFEIYQERFDSPVVGVDVAPDGSAALCCLESCAVWECDLLKGQRARSLHVYEQDVISGISYSPGGTFGLYAGSAGGVIDLMTGMEIKRPGGSAELYAPRRRIGPSIAFSHDDRLLATGQFRGVVEIWQSRPQKLIRRIETGSTWAYCVAFSPDDQTLLCTTDKAIHLFRVDTGEELLRLPETLTHANCAQFLPDGTGIVTGHGGLILDASGQRGLKLGGKYVYHDNVIRYWSL